MTNQKSIVIAIVLFGILLPLISYTQIAGTKANPVIVGPFGAGNISFTDTKNNGSTGYIDSYGYTNSSPGTGQPSNDIWYKLTIQGGATITFSTCNGGNGLADTYLHLLNGDYSFNYQYDDYGPACASTQASMTLTLAAGTYYLIAEGYGYGTGDIKISVSGTVQVPPAPPDTRNFIKTWEATAPETDANNLITRDLSAVKQTNTYFDGLGRPEQTIIKKGSLSATGNTDLVSAFVYDAFGREAKKYLPYVSPSNDGLYKSNVLTEQNTFYAGANSPVVGQGETFFYGQTDFESSPLNRPLKQMVAGNSWVGAGRGTEIKYWTNTTTDDVKKLSVTDVTNGWGTYNMDGAYDAGTLYKNITVDEQGKQVVEFKDTEGKVILKKVQFTATADAGAGSGYAGWLCTYYIYDDLSNLRCVIQPNAVKSMSENNNWALNADMLNELCFRYEYDQRNHMIMKKVPGAGEVWMVYDTRDRLVLTQDANMRAKQQWMYTEYENNFNRPQSTGLITDPANYNNLAYHRGQAAGSITYPVLQNYVTEELTRTFYDSYNWVNTEGNRVISARYTGDDAGLMSPSSTNAPYPEAVVQSGLILGLVTGTKTKVLGTSQYLYSSVFYDDKGRVIQTFANNITGGNAITTNQYSFSGQLLVNYLTTGNNQSAQQTTGISTKNEYDNLGRLLSVKKTLITNFIGGVAEKTILQNSYDALGHLINKTIAPAYSNADGTTGLEKIKYEYNIRGWLLGANRGYVAATGQTYDNTHFGFELGYDKITNSAGKNFAASQWNGNINGMVWKSDGDDVKRKYDFTYDAANRLMSGNYEQDDATSNWNSTTMNYNMKMGDGTDPVSAYDANGNIKRMQQWGWKLSGNAQIDNMDYGYFANSNKLSAVTEQGIAATDNKLGDFTDKNTAGKDYAYDANGNMNLDKNKNISSIVYNYLNLPAQITVDGKGTISYIYDAAGNKLKKVTVDNTISPAKTTTTLYIAYSVFENDVLQFIGHEEGRVRFTLPSTGVAGGFAYDYFLKDHLGNIRMVLTEEKKTDKYPVASLEPSKIATEKVYYDIQDANVVDKSAATGITNYVNDNGIGNNPTDASFSGTNNAKLYKLNSNSAKTGLGITLKVMAGDKLDVFGKSYYFQNTSGTGGNSNIPVADLLTAFLGGATGAAATGVHGPVTSGAINIPANLTGITNMIGQQNNQSNGAPLKPRAFINVVFFDEQFKSYDYRVSMVGNNSAVKDHYSELQNIKANKNGYVYIYCSNESPVNVFFDNLQVVHTRGPELEETHYYPFGLTMAVISSRAAGSLENKRGFHGKEMQNKEFNDGSGLELYDFGSRDQDPQLGRWCIVDPKTEKYFSSSPYNFVDNNPISRIDPTGQDWFYYQGKDEKNAAWHWQKGHSAKYTGTDGKSHTTKTGYRYIAFFNYDKGTTFNGGHRGTLVLYDQNKVLKTSSAFSGGGAIDNFKQAGAQNYFMNLGQRGVMPKENKSSDNDNHNPPATSGMQQIEEGTTVTTPDGEKHDVNSDYGNYRIRLNPTSGTDRGLYLHGKNSFWTSRTHGCVCEKDQEVLQYIWDNKGINVKAPFAVGQEKILSDE